jgi:hypothetical protein
MDYQNRIKEKEHKISSDLWKELDNLNNSNFDLLIESLEKYVSNGFFGAAAELSDTLESSPHIDSNPSWRVRIELERMKRYYCLGFENLMITSSNRVLKYLSTLPPENQTRDNFLLWKGTAIGHQGWIRSKPIELKRIIKQCKDIRDNFSDKVDKIERTCFIQATEGRLLYLQKEFKESSLSFEKAIKIADDNSFLRSSAHIKIIYAEHLALCDEWEKACDYAKKFLLNAAELHFKTHLLIRAFIILLEAPKEYLTNKEKDFQHYIFRYQILLHAMGLSQSQELNPLLAKAKEIIPRNKLIDFYYADMRTELKKRILDLASQKNGEQFENLIGMYYKLLNYKAIKLTDGFDALDLVAISPSPRGINQFEGIQVKSGKNKITLADLLNYGKKLLDAKNKLATGDYTDGIKITPITVIHWYTIESFYLPAYNALVADVHHCFGKDCILEVTNLDKLIDEILSKSEILVRIIFSKELEIE